MTVEPRSERIEDIVKVCGLSSCMKLKALIDSGADKTIIPKEVADIINVRYTDKEIYLEDVSGTEILSDEAIANIEIPNTACRKEIRVVVPRNSLLENEIIIGNDFMKDTLMQIGYHGGPNISCPKDLKRE